MSFYLPENQEKAVLLIESEMRKKELRSKCSTCGEDLHAIGVNVISEKLAKVACHCGFGGHNEYDFTVSIDEI